MASISTLFFFLWCIPSSSFAELEKNNHSAQGASILKEIEPNFTKSPIFLNPDEEFKAANKRKLLEAIRYLEDGLASDTGNGNILYSLGLAYSFAHDLKIAGAWKKSVEYLGKAIEIEPDDYRAHMVLGKNYMDAGRFDESYREYEKVDALVPHGFALRNMAFVRMAQERTDEAQVLLKKYIQHNPKDQDTPKILNALEEGRFERVET